jgi:hypothetical protein
VGGSKDLEARKADKFIAELDSGECHVTISHKQLQAIWRLRSSEWNNWSGCDLLGDTSEITELDLHATRTLSALDQPDELRE